MRGGNLFLLFLVGFVSLSYCYCPNDCSTPNGECSPAEVCICNQGWAGDDCSITDIALRNGVPVTGSLSTKEWNYFHILANAQQASLTISVNQTSTGGDLDTYIKLDSYPSRQDYDMRDISTSRTMKFEIPSPHGVYYVGIYGFITGDYSISASLKTNCPNDCSSHGTCNFDGTCTCHDGYGSDDCSEAIPVLRVGVEETGDLNTQKRWQYYLFNNDKNTIEFTLTEVGENSHDEDCDLYVKKDGLPKTNDYDYKSTTANTVTNMWIYDAEVRPYYVGVYAYTQSCSYLISAETSNNCPNYCSDKSFTHGTCGDTYTCSCYDGFSGETCETKDDPLVADVTQSGYAGGHLWNHYHFSTATANNVEVTLKQKSDGADCDLYIKAGAPPTRFDFDFRDVTFAEDIVIVIEDPSVNTWYVGVYGYKQCEYDLKYHITNTCPNDCGEHGTCQQDGHCVCDDGWVSQDCSKQSQNLENGVKVTESVAYNDWSYFHFDAIPGTIVTILVHEKKTEGFVWVYESVADSPTHAIYDQIETETTNVHRIVVNMADEGTIRIGLYGSSLGQPDHSYGVEVIAW
eukprot:CAMPEP_0201524786 /NCGR_PEP_ID=MMETSP0161_2-20130828/25178_1 /ASSEMBLY_ACC=CAM_ASM_000251 /TAXON_ID=180227 /ORGANISM="Neoparamoeba aestuarina, Strain SoJaBio B1-5/56/2" /LENGTH=572 /DNA_ID=CAMNT_0047924371 /DNA_START=79 /DNA_END=1794 /DNA_ORIENTATION=-